MRFLRRFAPGQFRFQVQTYTFVDVELDAARTDHGENEAVTSEFLDIILICGISVFDNQLSPYALISSYAASDIDVKQPVLCK